MALTSELVPPLDYSDNGLGMVVSCSLLAALGTIFVGFRFWAKQLSRVPFSLDDYLNLAALFTHHALFIASMLCVTKGGLGRDVRLVVTEDPNALVNLFKAIFVSEIAYGFSSSLVKLSVLAFYLRIFPTRQVKLGCYILGALCIGWTFSIEIVNFLQCRPLQAFWHQEMQALPTTKCLDTILFFLGNSIVNCCIDLAALVLPLREIAQLHTSRYRKIAIGSVFLLGSIAFAASLLRTISTGIMHQEGVTNFTKQFVTSGVATVVEIYVAIIGACLPCLMPIYRKLRYGTVTGSRNNPGNSGSYQFGLSERTPTIAHQDRTKKSHAEDGSSFKRLHDDEAAIDYHSSHNVSITSWTEADATTEHKNSYQMHGIKVTSALSWSKNVSERV